MFRRALISFLLLLQLAVPALALTPVREGAVKTPGASLAYRVYGSGEPLLCITGYRATMDAWPEALLEDLARQRTVIVFDNRGMAYSTASARPFSIEMFAGDAAAVLRGLGLSHAAVLGWSMGGTVAQELALAHPDMVDKLVLYATDIENTDMLRALNTRMPAPGDAPLAHLFPAPWRAAHPGYLALLPKATRAADPEVAERQKQAIARWGGTRARLSQIRMPVLFIVGAEDVVTSPAKSREAAALVGGPAWLAVFGNAGHGLMFQAPHDFARTVLDFLDVGQTVQ